MEPGASIILLERSTVRIHRGNKSKFNGHQMPCDNTKSNDQISVLIFQASSDKSPSLRPDREECHSDGLTVAAGFMSESADKPYT